MEKLLCPTHKQPCILKTGTKPGKTYGQSFYMCTLHTQCGFVKNSKVPPMTCPHHGELVEFRYFKGDKRQAYKCTKKGKPCGYIECKNVKENINPNSTSSATTKEHAKGTPTVSTSSSSSTTDKSPAFLSPPPSLDTPELNGDDKISTKTTPHTETSEESPISVATSSDPDCAVIDDYTSDASSHVSETSSSSEFEMDTVSRTASGFHIPEPPKDVSVLFMDETDYQENSSVEQSLIKQRSVGLDMTGNGMMEFVDPHSSPVLNSPVDIKRGDSNGEGGSHSVSNITSDSSPSLSSEASPTLSYQHSSGSDKADSSLSLSSKASPTQVSSGEEEERDAESPSLSSGKADSSPSLSSEASPTQHYQVSSEEEEEREGGNTSLGSGKPDSSPFLSSEASPTQRYQVSGGEEEEREGGNSSLDKAESDISSFSNQASLSQPHQLSEGEDREERSNSLDRAKCEAFSDKASLPILHGNGGNEDKKDSSKKWLPVRITSQSPHSPVTSGGGALSSAGSGSSGGSCRESSNEVKVVGEEQKVKEERSARPEPQFIVGHQYRTVQRQLMENEVLIRTLSDKLPDGGAQLRQQKDALLARLEKLKKPVPDLTHPLPSGPDTQFHHKNRLTYQARILTAGAVEHLHSSLANCPTEDTLDDDPKDLRVTLMKHQRRALAWMRWRENQTPSAGILADDMGLGKTLSLISLIVQKRDEGIKEWMAKPPAKDGLVKSSATLVVCPASLMMQWAEEVKTKLLRGTLNTKIYHGSNRTSFSHELAGYDMVITTYNIVGIEGESCEPEPEDVQAQGGVAVKPKKKKRTSSTTTLFKIHWRRVILDEAHVIRNHKTALSLGACKLASDYRWAVTGTPIQNQLKDFYSLIKFIRLAPFDDFRVWRDTVERKGSIGMKRLDTVVSSLVLRRTKEDINKTLNLTKRSVESHTISLQEEEKQVYNILFTEARKVMYRWLMEQGEAVQMKSPPGGAASKPGATTEQPPAQTEEIDGAKATQEITLPIEIQRLVNTIMRPYLTGTAKGRCVLGLLLRLRQCCCHLSLLTSALHRSESEREQEDLDLELAMGALSLDGRLGTNKEDGNFGDSTYMPDEIPPSFKVEQTSTKVVEVLKQLQSIASKDASPPEKSVIVSQWTGMLNIMQHHLDAARISHVRIDGSVPPAKRLELVASFNRPHRNPTVMLLSLQAGGVGLNLIGGNHIFMLDMHWNPALEIQAGDRCHRMGQKRDVFIHKFVCEDTVEERIQMLQRKKLDLAQSVLDGASEQGRARFKRNNKLSLNDLKLLFEIQ